MHTRIIPYHLVATDSDETKRLQDTAHPTFRSQRFNTAHHTRLDISAIVPESPVFTHEQPPWTAYGYTLWHPLIIRSQEMASSHIVTIPSFLSDDMMRCHASWIRTNRFPFSLVAETVSTWKSTQHGQALLPLLDDKQKWFIRLDQMSPKDSPFGGKEPSSTFEDVVVKICSSMRAWGCLQREQLEAKQQNREMKIQLVLNAWDDAMDPRREFRAFVPPPTARGAARDVTQLQVTCVSQYHWPLPLECAFGFSLQEPARLVCAGANGVLQSIKTFMQDEMSVQVTGLLLQYGFSFDVALQRDGTVRLVEVNPSGALSGCGACLFNWVSDGRVMYGLDEDVEFIVTMDEGGG
ncbi:uncharacterized protein EKO05_0007378 [Ascochyta rabiei]|uniref:Uncharacterized protein n=1 Tax=Didymella rabiei TaxID=5454 RepID=A0A163HTK3_DIDRA|nr:uncharacterized protein EKO05_0007378 [Ascochyta rabiei]KZM25461.1 hypothetical protein ST47_g3385 [Ascochyta rabiei]UPX17000.1 hypothetical protein EKO05_0007378 [Ascochyta rabiei]